MPEHLSRKELKQDKFRESIEHGAEAVYSHGQVAAAAVGAVLLVVLVYGGWKFYSDRRTLQASAGLDEAMKIYNAPLRTGNQPIEAGEISYPDSQKRSQDASQKFAAVADRYPSSNPGRTMRIKSRMRIGLGSEEAAIVGQDCGEAVEPVLKGLEARDPA